MVAARCRGAEPGRTMRALKALVIVMAVMIVAGVTLLIVAIAGRLSRPGAVLPQPVAAAPLDLPPGARIEAMTTTADRLVIGLALPAGDRRVLILDLATGRSLGTIELRASP